MSDELVGLDLTMTFTLPAGYDPKAWSVDAIVAVSPRRPHMTQLALALYPRDRYERKAAHVCTYPGCREACSETSVECEGHAEGTRQRQRDRRGRLKLEERRAA